MAATFELLFQLIQRKLDTRLIVQVDAIHLVTRNLAEGLLNEFFSAAWIVLLVLPGAVSYTCWAYVDFVELIPMPKDALKSWEVFPIFSHRIHDLWVGKVFWNRIIELNGIGILVFWVFLRKERLEKGKLVRVRFVEHNHLAIQVLPAHLDTMLYDVCVIGHRRPISMGSRETAGARRQV